MNTTQQFDIGLVGLGVMGRNLMLNIAEHGYSIMGLDKDDEKVNKLLAEAQNMPAAATSDVSLFLAQLSTPRKIILLVPAGQALEAAIETFMPLLSTNDLLIDGGNSFFQDTNRRTEALAKHGIHFMGMGISGGAEGARRGPSMMPGGERLQFESIRPILVAVAAKVDGKPCMQYVGKGGAGHFVKMVHNGIEYGMMQLISETYHILRDLAQFDNQSMHELFGKWNNGRLNGYLIEITAHILKQKDPKKDGFLLNAIMDKASQKGTGKWTSQVALDLGVPIPTIDAAVTMRNLSAYKSLRQSLSTKESSENRPIALTHQDVENALFFSILSTYIQGFALLQSADEEYKFGLNLAEIAQIWKGGCIVRARMLEEVAMAYHHQAKPQHLFEDKRIMMQLKESLPSVRTLVALASNAGIPVLALSSSLAYFDAFTTAMLPTNLIQAQRDYFGQHTYQRLDQEGNFQGGWN